MKANWGVIKLLLLIIGMGVLVGFTRERNNARKISKIDVKFTDENSPFITLSAVNKLLIQNNDSVTSIPKEILVLKEMENRLVQHPMVRDAQVFITIDGSLGAKIEQRNPIARVLGTQSFYIDEDGKKMPLSTVYSARVPTVTGTSNTHFTELTPLLLKLKDDPFMNQIVAGIHRKSNGEVELLLRKEDFKVRFGKLEQMEKKFQNFKAFFQKAKKEHTLTIYKTVDLQFGSQVVATKK
ncbi:MAG: cell division protein FtsQ/DivIB [Flavobacteriaceae bacterium]|nr:cell division protein FtsQ/DivIB [Flavobacteriaceae bacterium]